MKHILATAFAILSICALPAQAEIYSWTDAQGVRHFSDRGAVPSASLVDTVGDTTPGSLDELVGEWVADGERRSELSIESNGRFVFDSRSKSTPEVLYMCGLAQLDAAALKLDVQAMKERFADGSSEQLAGQTSTEATIVRADSQRLVLRMNGETLSFTRG